MITENLALRQQLAACKTKKIKPRLSDMDRSFWVALRKVRSNWADALIIVKPETVIDWNRRRFRKYWLRFGILYVFFVIDHAKRKIVHLNFTEHPTAPWVTQQLREAFPFESAPKYLIFDRDSIFSSQVKDFIKSMGAEPKIISYRSPWQNGVAERWILSVRTELLNHVIIFSEEHLRRLLNEYVEYYNHDRCHLSLGRNTPIGRQIFRKPSDSAKVIPIPRLGGLQHKYVWRKAA